MSNVLLFQPFTSVNHKHLSDTIERQFRFLKKNKENRYFCLFDESEVDAIKAIQKSDWIVPIVVKLHEQGLDSLISVQDYYMFSSMYIARTYFVPAKDEHKENIMNKDYLKDIKYLRNFVPIWFSSQDIPVIQVVYDPMEFNYIGLMQNDYKMLTSMNNVPAAMPHYFADLGYYDLNKEVSLDNKQFKFTFGGTAIFPRRAELLEKLYELNDGNGIAVYIKTPKVNNVIDNERYEIEVSQSLFTYTIPSQDSSYMSFTRMLLALSQGTIPLIHPNNNLDCLIGPEFPYRKGLKEFMKLLTISPEELKFLLKKDISELRDFYKDCLANWKSTEYYKWLQENV